MRALFDKPSFLLPSPATVVDRSYLDQAVRGDMLQALWWTAGVALTGLAISIVLGMLLAVIMAQANWVERSVWPYLIAAQAGADPRHRPAHRQYLRLRFRVALVVCDHLDLPDRVQHAVRPALAEPSQHDLFTLKGASPARRLTKLQLPSALPAIFTGFRIAAGLSVIGAVVGELFFRKGGKGIGIRWSSTAGAPSGRRRTGCSSWSMLGIAVFVFFGGSPGSPSGGGTRPPC